MLRGIPWKQVILFVGIGIVICLAILAILSTGIFLGKIPEIYPAARGMIALGAFLSAVFSASFAQKNKMLIALLSGVIFYLLLIFISAVLDQPWSNKIVGTCLLFSAAGTLLGGACGALSKPKTKNKTKRRSSK